MKLKTPPNLAYLVCVLLVIVALVVRATVVPSASADSTTAVTPNSGSTAGGTQITITGSGFAPGTPTIAGGGVSCSLTADKYVVCWQNGTNVVFPISTDIQFDQFTISANTNYSGCGVTTTNQVYCWQFPDRDDVTKDGIELDPVPNPDNIQFRSVSTSRWLDYTDYAGDATTGGCGLDTAGKAYCWGANDFGQLGNGTNDESEAPVAVAGDLTFKQLVSGGDFYCGVTTNGAAYCWGQGANGVLGNDDDSDQNEPVLVEGDLEFTKLSAMNGQTVCGIVTDGSAYCWGANDSGQLGNGDNSGDGSWTPDEVSGGLQFASISSGSNVYTCGTTTTNQLYCWGDNITIDGEDGPFYEPQLVDGQSWTNISVSNDGVCGFLAGTVSVYCYYTDSGSTDFTDLPTFITGSSATYKQVVVTNAVGQNNNSNDGEFSCALTTAGQVNCWTNNDTTNVTPVMPGITFDSIAGDRSQDGACGLSNGDVYCWYYDGDAGDFVEAPELEPVNAPKFTQIAMSIDFASACGLTASSSVYCWGNNDNGQLGNGDDSGTDSSEPVLVSGGLAFSQIVGAFSGFCGLTTTNSAYCWGWNDSGQLGNGTTDSSSVPVPVSGDHTFTKLAIANNDKTCGMATDGSTWCWGDNALGALGNGTTDNSEVPVQVAGDQQFVQIAQSDYGAACGIDTSGSLWCWGQRWQDAGIMDDTADPTVPNLITSLKMQSVSGANGLFCALSADGATVYCWYLDPDYTSPNDTTGPIVPVSVLAGTVDLVTLDGQECTNLAVVSDTTITCDTPPHAAGQVDIVLHFSNGFSQTLPSAFTYKDEYLTISSSSSIDIDATGGFGYGSGQVTVDTNTADGYKLYISSSSTDTTLTKTSGSDTIPTLSVACTLTSLCDLNMNANQSAWGFRMNAPVSGSEMNGWATVPTSDNMAQIANTTDSLQTYTAYFGSYVTAVQPSGTYTGKVLYTAIAN